MIKKLKIKRKYKSLSILIVFALLCLIIYFKFINKNNYSNENLTKDNIISHYNKYVITNKETTLYDENKNKVGKIGADIELELNNQKIGKNTKYFSFKLNDNYYSIYYKDVDKISELSEIDDRYKNYIVFNENIVTNDITKYYDENDNLVYEINNSFDSPIIINEEDKYGIEFNNRLLYVKKDNVISKKDVHNTDQNNTSGIGILNYHAFYDESISEDKNDCTTEICHSKSQFLTHLNYFKNNNILTLKMKEVDMYIDGKINLPRSVLITIDDGGKTKLAVDMLTEYKMYATIFLVTSWFNPKDYYKTSYIELHSHSHNMHEAGICPTGQGGGIQCLSENAIQEDLKTSRELLDNTTYFCYPFYEYNDYSIDMLKKAGFTMAFIGESNKSDNLIHVGSDKFKIRRFVIVSYTTLNDLDKYFGQIH